MALNTSSSTKRIYLSIVGGKIAQSCEEGTPGAVSRENKNKKTVWEILHDSVTAHIKEMKIEDKTFGDGKKSKQLDIILSDIGENYTLSIPVESKYFDHFCSKIGSADLSKPIEIKPFHFQPKDSSGMKSGINLYQNGKKLDFYFSKEDPKGKPIVDPSADRMDDDEWKMYKLKERKFYCNYIMGVKAETQKHTHESGAKNDLPF